MSIDITAAIEKRLDEIRLLLALRGELTILITDAEEAAWGRPTVLSPEKFRLRLNAASEQAERLRLPLPHGPVDRWEVR